MPSIDEKFNIEFEISDIHWKSIYLTGAVFAIIVLTGTIVDIITGSITGGDLSKLPSTAIGRFEQFHENRLLGLYNLDLLNTIIQTLALPVYFALYAAHRKTNQGMALLAFIIFLVGTAVFISGNTALTMMDLSSKYFAASDEAQKILIAAAGEAMLAKGSHGSSSVFFSFMLPSIAGLLMSSVMLSGKIFSKITSYFGILGNILIIIYLILVTFIPAMKTIAVAIAAPGGIMLMIWMIMYIIKLFKLGRKI